MILNRRRWCDDEEDEFPPIVILDVPEPPADVSGTPSLRLVSVIADCVGPSGMHDLRQIPAVMV